MSDIRSYSFVIDTNVVFEGITQKGDAAGLIIELWLAGLLDVYVSSALAYEYVDVLSRKLSESRWQDIQPVLGVLLTKAVFVATYFSWRPSSLDPGDEHVIDCAMNAGAMVITANLRDFRMAEKSLGLPLVDPVTFINQFAEQVVSE